MALNDSARDNHRPQKQDREHDERPDPHVERGDRDEREALIERARQLGATADELEIALDALALQAEAVLHRLRGGRVH